MQPITVLFFGSQGAGKGTQVKLLAEYLQKKDSEHPVLPIETGGVFRSFIESDSATAKIVRELVGGGKLPPVFISTYLWSTALVGRYTGNEHLLLDGFPRRVLEAEVLDGVFELYKRSPVIILNIVVSSEEVVRRMKLRGRADDGEEQIQRRLAWYEAEVLPVIQNFRDRGEPYRVLDINGEQSVEGVHEEIVRALSL